MKNELLKMAKEKEFNLDRDTFQVVYSEPYIPYIPINWNGILVLSEAQNLSDSYDSYKAELKASFSNIYERLCRYR